MCCLAGFYPRLRRNKPVSFWTMANRTRQTLVLLHPKVNTFWDVRRGLGRQPRALRLRGCIAHEALHEALWIALYPEDVRSSGRIIPSCTA